MTLNDPLANALSAVLNQEKTGKNKCEFFPTSSTIKKVLEILHEQGYVGEIKEVSDSKGNMMTVNLLGRINKCGVIKPHFSVKKDGFIKFERRYLPSRNMGVLVVSTPQGIVTNEVAKKKGVGGKLLAYCY